MPYPTQWARNDPYKFVCCLCFKIFDIMECAVQDDQKIDICIPCMEKEKAVMARAEWLNGIKKEE